MAANWSSTTPQAPDGGLNVKWQKDGSGNISAYFLKGAVQTPWTQDIDGAGYKLTNAGLISATTGQFKGDATASMVGPGVELFYGSSEGRIQVYDRPSGGFKVLRLVGSPVRLWNAGSEVMQVDSAGSVLAGPDLYYSSNATAADGTWRYKATGAASLFGASSDGSAIVRYAPSGAAGSVITWQTPLVLTSNAVQCNAQFVVSGSGGMLFQGTSDLLLDFYRTSGGSDDKRSRIVNYGSAIGLERMNDAYSAILAYARLTRDGFYLNVPVSCSALTCAALPSSSPGAGTKQLWYDPADGNRVKFAA